MQNFSLLRETWARLPTYFPQKCAVFMHVAELSEQVILSAASKDWYRVSCFNGCYPFFTSRVSTFDGPSTISRGKIVGHMSTHTHTY